MMASWFDINEVTQNGYTPDALVEYNYMNQITTKQKKHLNARETSKEELQQMETPGHGQLQTIY